MTVVKIGNAYYYEKYRGSRVIRREYLGLNKSEVKAMCKKKHLRCRVK